MKLEFCKIYNVDNYQLLVMKENTSKGKYLFVFKVWISDDVQTHKIISFGAKEVRDGYFDLFNEQDAKDYVENVLKVVKT